MERARHRPGGSGKFGMDVHLAFAAFVLSHAGCGDDLDELWSGEDVVACWCSRCGQARSFGPPERGTGGTPTRASDGE